MVVHTVISVLGKLGEGMENTGTVGQPGLCHEIFFFFKDRRREKARNIESKRGGKREEELARRELCYSGDVV